MSKGSLCIIKHVKILIMLINFLQEFRWLVRKKDQINIESKLKVCRFIGEMTKFQVFSKVDTLFCIKQLLFDFSHHHIEMACALFEACGSFLYRSPDSHRRTKVKHLLSLTTSAKF